MHHFFFKGEYSVRKSRRLEKRRSEAEHIASSLEMQLLGIVLVGGKGGREPDGRFPPLIDGSCEVPFGRGCGRVAPSFERGTL